MSCCAVYQALEPLPDLDDAAILPLGPEDLLHGQLSNGMRCV